MPEFRMAVDHDASDHDRAYCMTCDNRAVHTRDTVPVMPKENHTPVSGIRIPLDVKAAAVARAQAEGKTLTDVVVEHLTRYGKGKPKPVHNPVHTDPVQVDPNS